MIGLSSDIPAPPEPFVVFGGSNADTETEAGDANDAPTTFFPFEGGFLYAHLDPEACA